MSPTAQAILSSWSFEPKLALGLLASLALYLRGWLILHRSSPSRFPIWRALAFAGGLAAFWVAIASPLDALSVFLLSAHMVQHLLLMSVAPPLILLGTPLLPLLRGLPRKFARDGVGPFLVWPALRHAAHAFTHPLNCWVVMAVTLCAWHVPTAFDLALRSPAWHKLEHGCFFAASLLFWWPVVRPFPSRPRWPLWSVPIYLLAADLLNTTLSAILTFSDHVLYRSYLEVPRLFGTTALADQSCAGVIMWVPGSLVFLVPAALIAIEYLAPPNRLVRPPMAHHNPGASASTHPVMAWILRTLYGRQTTPLINTPLQRGARASGTLGNRFNGFPSAVQTVKTVFRAQEIFPTPLKRGVNENHKRFDLLSVPLVGAFLRAQSGRRLLQTVMFVLAFAVILDGILGPQVSSANLAGVLPWTYWRVFVIIALLAAGNFFCMACPFMLFRELGRRLGLRQHSWPRGLRSKWLGVGLLVIFLWAYEVFSLWDKPIWTAWLIINYFLVAFAIDALFKGSSFCKYVCPIGQFQFVASLVSPLEVKVREPTVCASCKTHDCLRGNTQQRGCEMELYLPRKVSSMDCTFCLDCVRACPHDNIGVMAVSPGIAIVQNPQPALMRRPLWGRSIAALALVFVFAAFTNAALMVAPVSRWRDLVTTQLHLNSTLPVNSAIIALTLLVAPIVLVCGSVIAGRTVAGIDAPRRELIRRFSFALVPLGACMWAAHFLFHFLIGWGSAWPIVQRVVGDFGFTVANEPALLGSNLAFSIGTIHIVQTVLLDIGLLATLYLGWRIARAYAPQMRTAVRTIAPWSAVTVALYLFGVWTCLQPMQMRALAFT